MDVNGIGAADFVNRSDAARPVVVTGAGGFVGRHVVARLAAAGHRVIAVSRQSRAWPAGVIHARTPDLDGTRSVVDGGPGGVDRDRAGFAAWQALLAGAGAVVHLAAMAHLPMNTAASRRQLWRVNVRATDQLARAAVAAGVADLIFVSSIKAVGERSAPDQPLTEATPPEGLDCYGNAKQAAERRLMRLAGQAPGMRITMLRPPLVYGPGVGANMAALARLAVRGLPLPLGAIANRRSLIYVGNLADAIATILARADAPGGIYHVCDGEAVSTPTLVRALAAAQRRSVSLWPVPLPILSGIASLAGRDAQWTRLAGSLALSDAKFRAAFGWQPPFSMAQGLALQFSRDSSDGT